MPLRRTLPQTISPKPNGNRRWHFWALLTLRFTGTTAFDFGKTYLYSVRAVIPTEGSAVESDDSVPAVVTPREMSFPPAVPQGLIGAVIVGSPTNATEVELSWSINTETDLAGYRVYRSEQQDTAGELLTTDLLLSSPVDGGHGVPIGGDQAVQTYHDRPGESNRSVVVVLRQCLAAHFYKTRNRPSRFPVFMDHESSTSVAFVGLPTMTAPIKPCGTAGRKDISRG